MVTPHFTLQQLSRLLDILQQCGFMEGNVREMLARANIVVTDLGPPDEFEEMSRDEAAIEVVKRLGLG